jgi:hypothetical protein
MAGPARPMTKPKIHALPDRATRAEVEITLDETRAAGFDEVVVIGFKGRIVQLKHSNIDDTLQLLGALEYAKQKLITGMK